ncbi:helix-turn-helix domain-containing protein [Desulfurobacterium sp. TC5-1]|uniref:helix-turn-helix domain-containing protein n=1 Tax=Desulfurobacterium sp. TC5-1 TaxID=1158318 RepID=UPI0003B50C46|nr:helix-turn-helix domain-containing protein [Desulfurobacterium sp. TC5-1]
MYSINGTNGMSDINAASRTNSINSMHSISGIYDISDINRYPEKFFRNLVANFRSFLFPHSKNVVTSPLSPLTRYIFLGLYYHANKIGECFPSFRRIAKLTGISVSTVQNSIRKLEEEGFIKIKKHFRHNYYILTDFPSSITEAVFIPGEIFQYYLKPVSKIVLISLLWLRAGDEIVYKTQKELAEFLYLSPKTIRNALEELDYKGYIEFEKVGRLKFPRLIWNEKTW